MSGFGIAGTNAHVVLEEAPTPSCRAEPQHVLPVGKTASALREKPQGAEGARGAVADLLESDQRRSKPLDVCWTAATRRTSLDHRAAFVAAIAPRWSTACGAMPREERLLPCKASYTTMPSRGSASFVPGRALNGSAWPAS